MIVNIMMVEAVVRVLHESWCLVVTRKYVLSNVSVLLCFCSFLQHRCKIQLLLLLSRVR